MVLEHLERRVFVLQLPKRPLVDDGRVSSVVEYAWGNPRLYANTCALVSH